jgi:hypothetical protein
MKRLITIISCAFILFSLFYACTTFPAFPDELRAFFPYSTNEKISFHNENDSIVTFNIREITFSRQYTTSGVVKQHVNESESHFISDNIHIVENNELSHISGFMFALPTKLNISLSISGWGTSMGYTKDFNGNPYEESFAKDIGDTIRLSNEYGDAIFVKNKGLVKFDGFQSTWSLVE